MRNTKEVNSLLIFLSMGLEEKTRLNNYIIKKKDKIKNEKLNKISISDNKILILEKFKKSCLILNEFISQINELKSKEFNPIKDVLNLNLEKIKKNWNANDNIIKFEPHKFNNYQIGDTKNDEIEINFLHFCFKNNSTLEEQLKTKIIHRYKYYQIIGKDTNSIQKFLENIQKNKFKELIFLFLIMLNV